MPPSENAILDESRLNVRRACGYFPPASPNASTNWLGGTGLR